MMKRWIMPFALVAMLALPAPAQTQTGPLEGVMICLDPGHGGSDPGAVYDDGVIYLEEADINLDVAHGLKALLAGDGAAVSLTRIEDVYKSNRDRYTHCNGWGADILVSVHTNSLPSPEPDGAMALYFHEDDRALAQAIYDRMYPYLRDTSPHPEPKEDYFTDWGLDRYASGVLLKSDMPAAMMEPLCMSNPLEAALLTTPLSECNGCRRAQIAQVIYEGILRYYGVGGDSAPTVRILEPGDGAEVSGTVPIKIDAADLEDADGTLAVVWNVGGGPWQSVLYDGDTGLYLASWDTTTAGDGNQFIEARATDSAGNSGSDSIGVTVDNSGVGISLSATGYKVKGLQKADLVWEGAVSDRVDVYRDGAVIRTVDNTGGYTDNIDGRGGGSFRYQVCEAGSLTCSPEVTVTF